MANHGKQDVEVLPSEKNERNLNFWLPDGHHEDVDIKALKALFEVALETRNFEITQLVQRNNFFMIFQGVLLAGLVQSSHIKPVISFLVCLCGFCISIYQVRMACGSKFWQEYWEYVVSRIEQILLSGLEHDEERNVLVALFHDKDEAYQRIVKRRLEKRGLHFVNKLILKRYSASKTPIYVGIVLSATWFLLTLCTLRGYPPLAIPSFIVGF